MKWPCNDRMLQDITNRKQFWEPSLSLWPNQGANTAKYRLRGDEPTETDQIYSTFSTTETFCGLQAMKIFDVHSDNADKTYRSPENLADIFSKALYISTRLEWISSSAPNVGRYCKDITVNCQKTNATYTLCGKKVIPPKLFSVSSTTLEVWIKVQRLHLSLTSTNNHQTMIDNI